MTSILVVDDDSDITANLADILDDMGYLIEVANDPESALELARQRRFDIALLDFKMPGLDGADLYRQVKEVQPHLVAIMITAHAGSNGVERAISAGTWRVLRKPVDIPLMLQLINTAEQQPIILVVDDDREFCEGLWEVLRSKNYRVSFAFDEQMALSEINQNEFQVVLLDLHLGHETSAGIFERLLSMGMIARTIVVTGQRSESSELLDQMIRSGAEAVQFKPLDMGNLIHRIEQAI